MSRLFKNVPFFFFTALIGSSTLFSPFIASASPVGYPLEIADSMQVQPVGSTITDITHNWYSRYFSGAEPWPSESVYKKTKNSFDTARKDGVWGLYQYFDDSSHLKSVTLFWSETKFPITVSASHDSSFSLYNFLTPSGKCFYLLTFTSDSSVSNHYSYGSTFECSGIALYTSSNKIISYSGEYKLSPSAEGFVPAIPQADLSQDEENGVSWNHNCGVDVGCHLGNIGNVIKGFWSFFTGIFDFSEDNSLFKLFKFFFIPKDLSSLFDFSAFSDYFKKSLAPVFSLISFLKESFSVLYPVGITGSSLCHVGPYISTGDSYNSVGHLILFHSKVFGHDFSLDLCSFQRAIGGRVPMDSIRVFTSSMLFLITLFLWHNFIVRIAQERF